MKDNVPSVPQFPQFPSSKMKIFLFCVMLLVFSGPCLAPPNDNPSQCATVYENHNQTDYGPLKVRVVEGTNVIQVGTQEQPGAPGACFVLFTERDHKLVATAKADSQGRFELRDVAPGRYRLVARAEGLCTTNIPLEVLRPSFGNKTEILVHFRPTGIDTCSYGEVAPKHTSTTH